MRCRVYVAVIFVRTTIFYGGNLSPRRSSDFGSLNAILSVFNSRRTATNRSILPDRPTITSYIIHIYIYVIGMLGLCASVCVRVMYIIHTSDAESVHCVCIT